MKTKIGRPPTPSEKAKTVLLGAKYNPKEAQAIEEAVADSGVDKSKWLRNAALGAIKPFFPCAEWSPKHLHGKSVVFEVVTALEGPMQGTGRFDVVQRGDGLVRIRIDSYERGSAGTRGIQIYVPEQGVKFIKKLPVGSQSDFSVLDPAFRKFVPTTA